MSAETTGTPTAREVDPTTRWLGLALLVLVAAVLAVQLVFPYRQDWPAHLLGGGGILWVIAGLSPRWLRRVSALLGFGVVAAVGWVTEHLVFGPPDVVDVCFTLAGAVVAFPFIDQRIAMRGQGRIELRRLMVGKFDPPVGALLVGALGDRALIFGPALGFGSRFELDRGAQLVDRGNGGQRRIMRVRALPGALSDDTDLIQRQPALPHPFSTPRELRQPMRHGGDRLRVR